MMASEKERDDDDDERWLIENECYLLVIEEILVERDITEL